MLNVIPAPPPPRQEPSGSTSSRAPLQSESRGEQAGRRVFARKMTRGIPPRHRIPRVAPTAAPSVTHSAVSSSAVRESASKVPSRSDVLSLDTMLRERSVRVSSRDVPVLYAEISFLLGGGDSRERVERCGVFSFAHPF